MAVDPRQVKLIALYSTRYSVRGGVGLVFLLISLIFGLSVAHLMLQPVEIGTKQIILEMGEDADKEKVTEHVLERLVDLAKKPVGWALGGSTVEKIEDPDERAAAEADYEEWTAYLLDEHPAPLSAILLILLWGWPFIVALGGFDMFTGDIATRGLRFQLLRADRASIYFGRLFGSVMTFTTVLALLVLTVVVYMGFKLPYYDWGSLIVWGLAGLVVLILVSLPYIGLCSWVSAGSSSSFGSLTFCSLLIGIVPLFAMLGGLAHPAGAYAIYALPWGIQHYLFHHSLGTALLAGLGCLAYTALFVFLGYKKLTTRDL